MTLVEEMIEKHGSLETLQAHHTLHTPDGELPASPDSTAAPTPSSYPLFFERYIVTPVFQANASL